MLENAVQAVFNTTSFGGLVLSLICVVTTSYVIYQVWFHPLAAYPGPFFAKLTDLYSVVHAMRGDRHEDLYQLHQHHGRIVRIGPNRVTILDAEALEPIYGHQANVKKSQWYHSFYSVSIFNVIDRNEHARKRRVMSQAFSTEAVRAMEPHILSAIRDWCLALGDKHPSQGVKQKDGWSRPKDMVHWSACLIFDVLGEICFGKTFNTSLSDENTFFFPLMALSLARDPDTGKGYSVQELIGEVTLLLGAGADTANTALAGTWYFLGQHDKIRNRLTSLVRLTFPTLESIVSGPVLSSGKMSYLRAVIEESMRLCPPIPMDLPREVLPGGLRVLDWELPAGTVVGVPTYALHHSPDHFDQPLEYDPSRWLLRGSDAAEGTEGVSADVMTRQRAAFVPFSIGPRACIGRSVAMAELEIGVARALWLYDVRLSPGSENLGVGKNGEYKMKDNFIVGKEGPVMEFRARE